MARPRLIYLVDDTADYRFLVQQVFNLYLPAHQIRFFPDGIDLVKELDTEMEKPDVILMDIDMPQLNGFEALAKLKHHHDWQQVPVVMMTNRDQAEYRQETFRLGASAFLQKPASLMEIKSIMTRLSSTEGDFSDLSA